MNLTKYAAPALLLSLAVGAASARAQTNNAGDRSPRHFFDVVGADDEHNGPVEAEGNGETHPRLGASPGGDHGPTDPAKARREHLEP
jgi:hypothetical protein